MSYSLNTPCYNCVKKTKCSDSAIIQGAINGIHMMPSGTGHVGAGSITLDCCNKQEPQPEPATE